MSTWTADSTQIFKNVVSIFNIQIKFSQRYIANIIGAACNSRIPQANLHAVLNFVPVYATNFIQIWKFCYLIGTVVQHEQRITEKIS